jgi:hypothetical protein
VVLLLSAVVLDASATRTEESRIATIEPGDSPYLAAKRAMYYEGMARACRGRGINFVVPGGIYGPSPYVEPAVVPTIFTGTLRELAVKPTSLADGLAATLHWLEGEGKMPPRR